MAISSALSIARTGLQAAELSLQTTSNNIANANTEGYSRQEVVQSATSARILPYGEVGTGVAVNNVRQVRDYLLDASYRASVSVQTGADERNNVLGQIEAVFNEPSDAGIGAALDKFWGSWADLSNDPTNPAAKRLVAQSGDQLSTLFHSIQNQIGLVSQQTAGNVSLDVKNFNTYASEVASLNQDIIGAESGGQSAPTLRDQRNLLLDKMAQIAPITTSVDARGSETVYLGGIAIVDGNSAKALAVAPVPGPPVTYQLSIQGNSTSINNQVGTSGTLAANLQLLNSEIPSFQSRLDALASGIVTKVNTIHRSGWSAAGDALGGSNWPPSPGPTGSMVDFFDPTGTSASSIGLSSAVSTNPDTIAAGSAQNVPGQGDTAQALSQLRGDTTSILGYKSTTTTSFDGYFQSMITDLGARVADAKQTSDVFGTISKQADTRRQSVSGVSTDDEMVNLIKFQQAYSAAAKTITTAQEMTQALIDMIR